MRLLWSVIHPDTPASAALFHPDEGTRLGTACNRYLASVPAVKKSWGGQKIAHVSHRHDALFRTGSEVDQFFKLL